MSQHRRISNLLGLTTLLIGILLVGGQDSEDLPSLRPTPFPPSEVLIYDSPSSPLRRSYAGRALETPSPSPPSASSSSSSSSSSSFPSCRMGYGVKDYYPTEDGYFHHQTCFWCYHFTPKHRRRTSLAIKPSRVTLSDGVLRMDFMFKVENETYHFDLNDTEAWDHVKESLIDPLEARKLEGCCRDAITCCDEMLREPPEGSGFCPRTWDGWTCFSDTAAGSTVSFTCPSYAYKGQPECALKGIKTCWPNGTWAQDAKGLEKTEYASCSHRKYHMRNYGWEIAMHTVSILAVLPAMFTILYFRPLRVQRFYLHLNFLIALFGKALMNILDLVVMRIPEYSGEGTSILDDNTGGCKFLVFLTKVFSLAVWTWMLAESLYLHRLIVAALRGGGKTWAYMLIGWVPPLVIVGVWALARGLLKDYQCWLGDDHSDSIDLYLITEVPKLIMLVVNTGLLINMTRVLMSHLKSANTNSQQANKRALKASGFLLPMFGLQFFITLYIPPFTTPCAFMQAYTFIATAMDGLQGFYIALVYCYMNNEVRIQIRRTTQHIWQRLPTSAPDVTYDRRTDVSHIHSGADASVATMASTVD